MSTPDADRFVLIIGAMKSGTTTLFEHLSAHPRIAPSSPKEPDFFSADTAGPPELDAYRALWSWDPTRHQVALEGSTSYTMAHVHPDVPARIEALEEGAPDRIDFKFIYVMRDPVERIASHLSHLATRRGGVDRLQEADFERAVQVSRYATQLEPYRSRWSREAILLLVYEEMIDDPAGVVARVQDFLGLTPKPFDPEWRPRAYNTRSDLVADQVLSRAVDRAPWLGSLRPWIPGPMVRGVRRMIGSWGASTVKLTDAQVEQALPTIRPEVARLRSEWGLDTARWRSLR